MDRKSAEWSQKLLLGPLSTADVSKRKASFHPQKPALVGMAEMEKVKPIALTLQNNLKGFTFKIVLFDYLTIQYPNLISNINSSCHRQDWVHITGAAKIGWILLASPGLGQNYWRRQDLAKIIGVANKKLARRRVRAHYSTQRTTNMT